MLEDIALIPFIFVRHGSTNWSFDQLHLGELDLSLNEIGIKEVQITAKKFCEIRNPIIFSSPRKRTMETAHIIAEQTKSTVHIEIGLDARFYGNFSQDSELCQKFQKAIYKEELSRNVFEALLPKDAEKLEVFGKRIATAILQVIKNNHEKRPLIIVSHGEVYNGLCKHMVKEDLSINKGECRQFFPSRCGKAGWSISEAIHACYTY
ncbi:MAG: histidine phosphatase family protein [Chlamydiales bacterium]|nr:histidine phosphatase family protein [Chlamydiales bacterium]